jgi:predicted HTH domain antitoxin
MKSTTISSRITTAEMSCLDELAERAGQDRAGIIKSILRRGISELRLEQAIDAYRREEITLSRAAELAGLTQWELLARLDKAQIVLHYDERELEEDLAGFGTAKTE